MQRVHFPASLYIFLVHRQLFHLSHPPFLKSQSFLFWYVTYVTLSWGARFGISPLHVARLDEQTRRFDELQHPP